METVFTIVVGIVIGIVDAVPMLVKKMDKADCLSAFVQYVVATFIIFNTTLPQLNVSYIFCRSHSFFSHVPSDCHNCWQEGKESCSNHSCQFNRVRFCYIGNQASFCTIVHVSRRLIDNLCTIKDE